MSVHHNREALLAEIQHMPEGCFTDGVLIDVPKRRRRAQAMTDAEVRIKWPKEQKKRFATQYNRHVEQYSKDLGIEILLRKLEGDPPLDAIEALVDVARHTSTCEEEFAIDEETADCECGLLRIKAKIREWLESQRAAEGL